MRKCIYGRCFVEVKVGDIYIRHSDGKSYRVKRIDNKMVVLESLELEDGSRLRLTDIFGLEKAYSKRESKPTQ
jgi:hypothetical protein